MRSDLVNQVKLLTPREVANLFGVHPKTVGRWVTAGRIQAVRTLGGHLRFREEEVLARFAPAKLIPACPG